MAEMQPIGRDSEQAKDSESQIQILTNRDMVLLFRANGLLAFLKGEKCFCITATQAKKLMGVDAPEAEVCEFCGRKLEYLGMLDKSVIVCWSAIPQPCICDRSIKARLAREAEWKREEQENQRRKREEERQKYIQYRISKSGLKKRFLERTFARFVTDTPARKQAYQIAKGYADKFQEHRENGIGLYIEGTVGTGKTHLAAAIALRLLEMGYDVMFRTADDLLSDIKDSFTTDERSTTERFKTCDLLIVDDFGKEQVTDWSVTKFYAIINARYENKQPTIITTNLNETDLIATESKGSGTHKVQAILSRLHETSYLISMSWSDYREQ